METTKNKKESLNKKKSWIRRMVDFIKGDSFILVMFLLVVLTLNSIAPIFFEQISTGRCQVEVIHCNIYVLIMIIAIISLFIMAIIFMVRLSKDEKQNEEIKDLQKEKLELEIKALKKKK